MKISIITSTWNSEKTLQDTIDSVLRQMEVCGSEGIEVEHIIKDGGSTDGTLDIIRLYEARYGGRLKWMSAPDKGIYDGMNQGIEMATGDIVGTLNSDDFYTSDDVVLTIAKAFGGEDGKKLDAIYGDIHFVDGDDLERCTRYYSSRYFRPGLLRLGFMPAHPSFYCRREVYEKHGLYDLSLTTASDFEMMVRLFAEAKINARYVNKDFVTMRAGGETTGGLKSKQKVNRDIALSLKKHGIYTNQLFQMMRYAWRVGEVIYGKTKKA